MSKGDNYYASGFCPCCGQWVEKHEPGWWSHVDYSDPLGKVKLEKELKGIAEKYHLNETFEEFLRSSKKK